MQTLTRIATAVIAAVVSVFVAAPAFAAEAGEGERFNPADQFSAAGEPVNVIAILIVGAIILLVVLGLGTLIGNLFNKKDA